jgi:NADH:ubiquinone oxidoreductase subunit C
MSAQFLKLEAQFGGDARMGALGRSERAVVEIPLARAVEICSWARMEESLRLDFLEAFTIHEAGARFVLTWFARSLSIGHEVAIRAEVDAPDEREWLDLPSLVAVWPQAEPFETELSPLFGVRFTGRHRASAVMKDFGVPEGFPLRKTFLWGGEAQP